MRLVSQRAKVAALFTAALVFPSSVAIAQITNSTIRGSVSDPSGAAVVGAAVKVINTDTNQTRTVSTGETGDYEIPDLLRGTYRMEVSASGFNTFIADGIILETSQIRRIDAALALGTVGSQVTVQADAAVIETDTAKIQSGVTKRRYEVSPLVGGWATINFTLATLPNVQTSGLELRLAGQPSSQTLNGLDGVTTDGTVSQLIHMADMEEVKIVAANNTAEYRSVGFMNSTSKSGSNAWHGTAYYLHENSAFSARPFFSPDNPKTLIHTMGANLSGPIIRDKTFFFSSWSAERIPASFWTLRDVPTAAMRNGDFSQLLAGSSPRVVRDPLTNQAFPGNIIPSSRLNPVSLKAQSLYMPQPNQGTPNQLTRNYNFLHPYYSDRFSRDYLTNRIDHNFSEKHRIFGRVSNRFTPYVLAGNYPLFAWTRNRRHDNVTVEDTYVFSPTLVNTFRFGWNRDRVLDGGTEDGLSRSMAMKP